MAVFIPNLAQFGLRRSPRPNSIRFCCLVWEQSKNWGGATLLEKQVSTVPPKFIKQTWECTVAKIPEMAENSWNFRKLPQNCTKIKEFVEFLERNFLKSGISWRTLMPVEGVWGQNGDLSDSCILCAKSSDAFYGIEKASPLSRYRATNFQKTSKFYAIHFQDFQIFSWWLKLVSFLSRS